MERSAEDKAKINRFLGSSGLGQLTDPGLIPQIGFIAGKKIKTHDQFRQWIGACEPELRRDMYEAMKPYMKFGELKPLDVYEAETKLEAEIKQLPTWEDGKFRAFNPTRIDESELDRLAREAIEKASDELDDSPEAAALRAEVETLKPGDRFTFASRNIANPSYTNGWTNGKVYEEFGILPGKPVKAEAPKTETQQATEILARNLGRQKVWVVCGQCTKEDVFEGWDKKAAVDRMRDWGWTLDPVLRDEQGHPRERCPECSKR